MFWVQTSYAQNFGLPEIPAELYPARAVCGALLRILTWPRRPPGGADFVWAAILTRINGDRQRVRYGVCLVEGCNSRAGRRQTRA